MLLTGAHSMVLLPGMDGTGLLFQPFIKALPAHLKPHLVSYPATEPLDYAALLPMVRAALPRDTPFILLGESFSGPLALMAAAEAPPGLRAVVLCASFIQSPVPWLPRALRFFLSPGLFRLAPSSARARALLGDFATPSLRALLDRANATVTPSVMAARARAILDVNASAALRACAVPILYLRAEHDRMVPRECWQLIFDEKPSAKGICLPGPHLLLQALPAAAVKAIEAFAESVASA
jgi:pimeloyl-[acyl-carrier protein] methyl ester esterase